MYSKKYNLVGDAPMYSRNNGWPPRHDERSDALIGQMGRSDLIVQELVHLNIGVERT